MKAQRVHAFAWVLSGVVSLLAIIAWVQGIGWELDGLNAYSLFPLLGLLAFSLMWTHYIVGATRRMSGTDKQTLKPYFAVTGWAAVIFILLHPSLLIFSLWRDGFGLPPNSYLEYVGAYMKWAVLLGTLSFLIFLSFETKRWFNKKGWWPIIEYANVVAMFAIVAHALALGNNLQGGWFTKVWIFYALSLVVSVGCIYYLDINQAKKEGNVMKKVIGVVAVVLLIAGIGVYTNSKLNSDEEIEQVTSSTQDTVPTSTTQEQQVYTLAEVQQHNTQEDCWTIISGSVYDLTSYVTRHPGGDDILRACGQDGTSLFTQRTDESGNEVGSGTPHSTSAASQLNQLKIGSLSQ